MHTGAKFPVEKQVPKQENIVVHEDVGRLLIMLCHLFKYGGLLKDGFYSCSSRVTRIAAGCVIGSTIERMSTLFILQETRLANGGHTE